MKNPIFASVRILSILVIVLVAPSKAQDAVPVSHPTEQPSKVAFASSTDVTKRIDIFEINLDGSGLRLITHDPKGYWPWNCCPAWSPDGIELAFVSQDLPTLGGSHAAVLLWESAGGTVRTLFRDNTMCPQDPAWSPDGKHLVFARGLKSRASTGRLRQYRTEICTEPQLFSIHLDGSGLHQLTHDETSSSGRPAWSPDGGTIVYVSRPNSNYAGKADIYLMDADGSSPRDLTHGGLNEVNADPTWSPNGTEIAFCSNRGGRFEVYVMNRDGTRLHQVTHDVPGGARHPSWSPDGRQIVFGTGDARAVYVMNADGTDARVLVKVGWHPVFGKMAGP
jgi:Tol biopolymer transport system component